MALQVERTRILIPFHPKITKISVIALTIAAYRTPSLMTSHE